MKCTYKMCLAVTAIVAALTVGVVIGQGHGGQTQHEANIAACKAHVDSILPARVAADPTDTEVQRGVKRFADDNRNDMVTNCIQAKEVK